MATNLAEDDILTIRLYCSLEEQVAINTIFYRVSILGGTPTDADALQELGELFAPLYKACMSTVARFEGVGCTITRTNALLTNQVFDFSDAGIGDEATHPLPGQVCGLIRKVSNAAGRHAYGRVYIPFPAEGFNEADATPTSGYIDDLNAIAANISAPANMDAGGGNLFGLQGRHRVGGSIPGSYLYIPLTQVIARGTWATMRSRSDYSAANKLPWE